MQIAMLNLKKFSPAGGKARYARRIFAVAKFFINSVPEVVLFVFLIDPQATSLKLVSAIFLKFIIHLT